MVSSGTIQDKNLISLHVRCRGVKNKYEVLLDAQIQFSIPKIYLNVKINPLTPFGVLTPVSAYAGLFARASINMSGNWSKWSII